MQAPIVKDNNLQYIVDIIFKELTALKTETTKISKDAITVKTFDVVKYADNDYRIEVQSPEGIAVSSALTLKGV